MIGISPRRTYLDWASAAPVSPRAWRAFMNATKLFGNPGSVHADGVAARVVLEEARTRIARLAGTKSDGVIFTSGATESNNLSILGYLHLNMKEMSLEEMHVLYLSSAHSSTTGPVERFGSVGVQIEPVALQGATIDEEALKKQIRPTTVLVVMEAVCGETGTRFDTRNVRRILNAISPDRHIALHVDASQLPLVGSFEHTHLGADMITLDAQKVGGVRGSGVLILPKMLHCSRLRLVVGSSMHFGQVRKRQHLQPPLQKH
ncbi:aminotransferase class V-fold PLP-dependent enzyme [Patescibacteria group bacterium]|nr:aminotransferase class V-fold PLP-dependent enzyme [Patescibacteria group bacterium]